MVACIACLCLLPGSPLFAQKSKKKPIRAEAPTFQPSEFAGVFFINPMAQLQGAPPSNSVLATSGPASTNEDSGTSPTTTASGNDSWKQLISAAVIEDLVKESKSRIDGVVTSPAKFAGGGYSDSRREFTLLASLMAVISQYPDDIRWKASSSQARTLFARLATNCKVGTQQVFNEAKLRQQDLQELLKGSKLSGSAEEITWADTADRAQSMKIMDWTLREHLAPFTSSDSSFEDNQDEIIKYAELLAMLCHVLEQEGMTNADDQDYVGWVKSSIQASHELVKATKNKDADQARAAVGKIDQSCGKCHDSFR